MPRCVAMAALAINVLLLLQWSHQGLSQAPTTTTSLYPVHVSQTACFAKEQRGTKDRTDRNVSIVRRNWVSHSIVTSILEIVLSELVRFNVLIVDASTGAQNRFAEEMESTKLYEIDPELWWDDLKGLVENMGPIGYFGRSGLYTLKSMQARSQNPKVPPFVSYYKMYDNATTCADIGYLTFPESTLRGFLGSAFPVCNTSSHPWCGKGSLEGYWAPPLCQTNPNSCIEIYMVTPNYDTGYFEQLTSNLKLLAVYGYYGFKLPDKIKSLQNASKTPVFYYWEPSQFLHEVDVIRIQFPDFTIGCDRGDKLLPSGPVACDYPNKELKKVATLQLKTLLPEAYYSLKNYEVTKTQLDGMMRRMRTHNESAMDVACHHLRSNPNWINTFAPVCMIRPAIVPKMGDLTFNAAKMSCVQQVIFANAPPHGQCFATRPGTVDRSSTVLSLAVRDWASQIVVSYLIVIILEEFLGYKVTALNASTKGQLLSPEDIDAGIYDIEAEFWHKNGTSYQTYVHAGIGAQVVDAGPLGYYGRSGLFTLKKMLSKNKYSSYWETYQDSSYAAAQGFMTVDKSQHRPLGHLQQFLGDLFPVCNISKIQWCTTGQMTGYWVPPSCSAHPAACLEIFMKRPTWDEGYFEQLTKTLGIPAIHSYYGNLFEKRIRTLRNHTSAPIFYWFAPDKFIHEVDAVRISFPNYQRDCNVGTNNPNTGTISCDYQESELVKLVSRKVTQASEAYFFLKGLLVYNDQIDEMLQVYANRSNNRSNSSGIEFDIACEFLSQRPQWIKKFVPDEIVKPIPLQNLMVGDTWFDPVRLAVVNVSCPLNASLQINLQAKMWSCRSCPDGFKPNQAQTACIDTIQTTTQSESDQLYVVVIVSLSGGIMVLGMCSLLRMKHKRAAQDSPVRTNTPTGAWIISYVGPHIHGRLATGHELVTHSSTKMSVHRSSTHKRGNKKVKKGNAWLVNATPFCVSLTCPNTYRFFKLSRRTFIKAKNFDLSWSLQIDVDARTYYADESQAIYFDITDMEWQLESAQKPMPIKYDCPVLRCALPNTSDGKRMGHIKFVKGPRNVLLICWSPPTEMRGMPLPEFENFLCQCLEHLPSWVCTNDQEITRMIVPTKIPKLTRMTSFIPNMAKMPSFMPPMMHTIAKSRGDIGRNMYDANENLIRKEIAVKDISYAELFTDVGAPTLFASHVWNVSISTTLQVLRNLDLDPLPPGAERESSINEFEDLAIDIPENDVKEVTDGLSTKWMPIYSKQTSCSSMKSLAAVRIWFCTACNNQSRVQEELGDDVSQSPFARVISASYCQKMLLFCPLDALERKWCNYEFSVAKSAKKQVLLATIDGIVQAGRVAPRALHELAEKAKNFRCDNATCYSKQDEALIDAAVERVGGYAALNNDLRTVFAGAITDAHLWTSRALGAFELAPSVSTSPAINVDDTGTDAGDTVSAPLSSCAKGMLPVTPKSNHGSMIEPSDWESASGEGDGTCPTSKAPFVCGHCGRSHGMSDPVSLTAASPAAASSGPERELTRMTIDVCPTCGAQSASI